MQSFANASQALLCFERFIGQRSRIAKEVGRGIERDRRRGVPSPAMFIPRLIDSSPHEERFWIGYVASAALQSANDGDMSEILSLSMTRDASNMAYQPSPIDVGPEQFHYLPPPEAAP